MKIVNKVKNEGYIQWIEKFVAEVLNCAEVECEQVIIYDLEPSKRIYIYVDGADYTIRTWNYHVIEYDDVGCPCAELVDYTLFKMVRDETGGHGEPVDENCARITWVN